MIELVEVIDCLMVEMGQQGGILEEVGKTEGHLQIIFWKKWSMNLD
jgi:hypothetical protein